MAQQQDDSDLQLRIKLSKAYAAVVGAEKTNGFHTLSIYDAVSLHLDYLTGNTSKRSMEDKIKKIASDLRDVATQITEDNEKDNSGNVNT